MPKLSGLDVLERVIEIDPSTRCGLDDATLLLLICCGGHKEGRERLPELSHCRQSVPKVDS